MNDNLGLKNLEVLGKLKFLKVIKLSNCNLEKLPNELKNLDSLIVLNITRNPMLIEFSVLMELDNLKVLNLYQSEFITELEVAKLRAKLTNCAIYD